MSLLKSKEDQQKGNEIDDDDKIQLKILIKNEDERNEIEKDADDKLKQKKKKIQNFKLSSPKVARPINTAHSPSRPNSVKKSIENSPSCFKPQPPQRKIGRQRSFRGRHQQMEISKAQVSLFQKQNENGTSTFSQENSIGHQKSNETSDPDTKNKFISNEKMKNTEADISEHRKTIIKLRIIKCLFKIGCTNCYNKLMNKMSYERKEASALLWFNRKSFEEDTREIKGDISECFNRLSDCEKESEILKQEIEVQKQITTKLAHWKELSLRSSDRILKQIVVYQKGPNIEVSKPLKKLDEKKEELDSLQKEAEEFESQLVNKVRHPMEEMSKIRRVIQK